MGRRGNPVTLHGKRGAGVYGILPEPHKGHKCGRCAYQGRGREDCPNNQPVERASQQVPYAEREMNQ